jgi:hypothetical protein
VRCMQAPTPTRAGRDTVGELSGELATPYAYNGEGLRDSQTISGTTTHLAWDMTEGLPLILSDATNSYIYGPGGIPVEQVSSGGTIPTCCHYSQRLAADHCRAMSERSCGEHSLKS